LAAIQLIFRYLLAPFRLLLRGPAYLIAAPRTVWGMSPAARAAFIVAAGLLLCTVIVVIAFLWSDTTVHGDYLRDARWIITILGVMIATPLTTYFLVKLWLQGETSKYPDIDAAWQEGLRALITEGIDLTDLPLHVVLGVPDESTGSALFAATQIPTVVTGMPRGKGPLHWYASSDAIYLVCTGLGRLGRLNGIAAGETSIHADLRQTLVASAATRTLVGTELSPEPLVTQAPSIMGTLVAGVQGTMIGGAAPAASAASGRGMSYKDAEEESDRLAYAMRRLRLARRPYCANNGVLTVVPRSSLIDATYAREAPGAVRSDIATVRKATGLASSVTLLVSGMEADEGFSELVRRVGVERARTHRIGKGFDVWSAASDESLDALSQHACGSFEDHVYGLFVTDAGEEPYSNGKLYTMLTRIRRDILPRLRRLLTDGYALDDGKADGPRLFSGCYFAATSKQPAQSAFVRSVFGKLDELAEELKWNDEALMEEQLYRGVTWAITLVNAVLLAILGYQIYRCILLIGEGI
jgi:hypothetical protein